jgi:hypothetical protein
MVLARESATGAVRASEKTGRKACVSGAGERDGVEKELIEEAGALTRELCARRQKRIPTRKIIPPGSRTVITLPLIRIMFPLIG